MLKVSLRKWISLLSLHSSSSPFPLLPVTAAWGQFECGLEGSMLQEQRWQTPFTNLASLKIVYFFHYQSFLPFLTWSYASSWSPFPPVCFSLCPLRVCPAPFSVSWMIRSGWPLDFISELLNPLPWFHILYSEPVAVAPGPPSCLYNSACCWLHPSRKESWGNCHGPTGFCTFDKLEVLLNSSLASCPGSSSPTWDFYIKKSKGWRACLRIVVNYYYQCQSSFLPLSLPI